MIPCSQRVHNEKICISHRERCYAGLKRDSCLPLLTIRDHHLKRCLYLTPRPSRWQSIFLGVLVTNESWPLHSHPCAHFKLEGLHANKGLLWLWFGTRTNNGKSQCTILWNHKRYQRSSHSSLYAQKYYCPPNPKFSPERVALQELNNVWHVC